MQNSGTNRVYHGEFENTISIDSRGSTGFETESCS